MQATPRPRTQAPAAARPARTCGACHTGRLTRISRVSFTDHLLSHAGLLPYICGACKQRTLGVDLGRMVSISLSLLVVVGLSAYVIRMHRRYGPALQTLARTPSVENTGDPLSNDDIARMGRVSIPSAVIQRLIYGRPHSFRIDSDSLIALKKDGVPDDVILAMVTVTLEHQPAAPKLPSSSRTAGVVSAAVQSP
jgi:hypothetical protein